MSNIFRLDTLIVLLYLTTVMSLGLYVSRSTSDGSKKYFFANNNVSWFIVALSLFATGITGNQVLGIVGMVSMDNLIPGQFGAIAALAILMLGWIFAPEYLKEKIKTVPEYLEKKYDRSSRKLFAVFSIIFYFFIRLSITLIAAGLILSRLLSIDSFTSSQIVVIFTGIYVIIGGFSAVVYTQAVQSFFILIAVTAFAILGIYQVGDFGLIWTKLTVTSNEILKPLLFSETVEILSFLGGLIIGIWFWCTDQFIVQRMISVRNEDHGRRATVLSGFLHIILMIIIFIIVISAGVLYSDRLLYLAFSQMFLKMTMQTGLNGLILTGTLAILMASLASLFNSIATIIVYDFSHQKNQTNSERKLVLKGRLITLAAVIFSILWIPIIRIAPEALLSILIKLPVFCSPAAAAIFLYARIHDKYGYSGAFPIILIGTIAGAFYTLLIYLKDNSQMDSELIN
ncbi:MAG TPA: hypothetical protein ENO18_01745, partial [Caldithrix sp.]|nr:hypothetical protein [Caldithrix sp.]